MPMTNNRDVQRQLVSLLSMHVLALFNGTEIESKRILRNDEKNVVSHNGPTKIKIVMLNKFLFVLFRSQQFTPDEFNYIKIYCNNLEKYNNLHKFIVNNNSSAYNDIINSIVPITISEMLAGKDGYVIKTIIDIYIEYSSQTYEGRRLCCGIGVDINILGNDKAVYISDIYRDDYFKVLSNGYDTFIVCNKNGEIVEHKDLKDEVYNEDSFSPIRFSKISNWTKKGGRSAIILTQNGEILIFHKNELAFARRRGEWIHFSHVPVVKQMGKGKGLWNSELRKGIYLTCLDVSFKKSGGCIGLIQSNSKKKLDKIIHKDYKLKSQCTRSIFFNFMCKNDKFIDMSRLLRLELLSVDGAMVIGSDGKCYAIGAILNIKSKRIGGGGRTAAAKNLAGYGLGIKVSNDGFIEMYWTKDKPKIRVG